MQPSIGSANEGCRRVSTSQGHFAKASRNPGLHLPLAGGQLPWEEELEEVFSAR